MTTYVCFFELMRGRELRYKVKRLSFVEAQAAFGSYCAKNHLKPLKGWRWVEK